MSNDLGIEIDECVLVGFLDESREALSTLDSLLIQLESDSNNSDLVNSIFRPVHSIKGNAPFFGLMKLKNLAHEFESLLAAIRDKKVQTNQAVLALLLSGVDEIKRIIERVSRKEPEITDEKLYSKLIADAIAAAQGALSQQGSSGFTKANTESSAAPTNTPPKVEPSKTMRVPEERIDTFLSFVGELVIAQDMMRHFSSKVQSLGMDYKIIHELGVINGVITDLSSKLEKAIMSIRMVPIKSLLQKMPRLIRDVAVAKNKEITVQLVGEDIEIDKSLLELLDAPLTHMARNAADHGIELPTTRQKSGKSKQGTVKVICEENPSDITLHIEDDGGGINYAGLQKKAESLGIIGSGQTLSENQVIDLIFMPGVSTAQQVSDISGRGVGMDVVKRNVEAAGGVITVTSKPGLGSKFTIKLPKSVTTQIIQGFVFQVKDDCFVLPLERVHESWDFKDESVVNLTTTEKCIQRNRKSLPLYKLSDMFGYSSSMSSAETQLIIRTDASGKEVALMVDKIIGPRQLVLKPINTFINPDGLFMGGALMGDGNVALVLDVDKLVH